MTNLRTQVYSKFKCEKEMEEKPENSLTNLNFENLNSDWINTGMQE